MAQATIQTVWWVEGLHESGVWQPLYGPASESKMRHIRNYILDCEPGKQGYEKQLEEYEDFRIAPQEVRVSAKEPRESSYYTEGPKVKAETPSNGQAVSKKVKVAKNTDDDSVRIRVRVKKRKKGSRAK